MVITVQRWLGVDDERREHFEFLLNEVGPLLARLQESHVLLSRDGAAGEEEAFDRLLAARDKLKAALGEALIEHIADGGRIELGS